MNRLVTVVSLSTIGLGLFLLGTTAAAWADIDVLSTAPPIMLGVSTAVLVSSVRPPPASFAIAITIALGAVVTHYSSRGSSPDAPPTITVALAILITGLIALANSASGKRLVVLLISRRVTVGRGSLGTLQLLAILTTTQLDLTQSSCGKNQTLELSAAFSAAGWSNGTRLATGAGYGLRISRADRDLYFDPSWDDIVLEFGPRPMKTRVRLSESLWRNCHELRSAAIGRWLLEKGLAPWPAGKPPQVHVQLVGERTFRVHR